jgi:type I restriction enzyme S subunit
LTTLEHYAEINPPPGPLDRVGRERVAFVPMAAVTEEGRLESQETRSLAEVAKGYTYFERGDVLMAKITPCMENGKAALVDNLATQQGFGSTEFHVLRPRPGVDPRFLFYLVWNQSFRDEAAKHMSGSAGQKRVPSSYLKQARVPLLDSQEQRRIADILDKADAIRRKRKEASALTEELLRSTFLEMFGDPVTNPRGWPLTTLGDEAEEMKYGTSVKCEATASAGFPVLRIPNVAKGEVDWSDLKFATLGENEVASLRLRKGDILFVRTNGNPAYIGRCAVYHSERAALFASYLIRVRLKLKRFVPVYVRDALSSPSYRALLTAEAQTTAGNYNISTQGLRRLRLPLPPLPLQQRFEKIASLARSGGARLNFAGQCDDTLFQALVQQAFSR